MSIDNYFSTDGKLAQKIKGFKHRPQQVTMANAVHQAIQESSTLVVEAGTGVGKTFAYLIPAMLSGKKIVVSTGTRHLQDQLFYTDLPLLQHAASVSINSAILKGRSNYLCKYRFERFEHDLGDYPRLSNAYREVKDWSVVTKTGDVAEVNELSEQSEIWSHVTSTRDNCLGGECPDYNKCHLLKARKRAQESDLVVINHHLLCADLVLKGEGFGELLPSADVFVLDEAHQLTDVLPNFFGSNLSSRQLQDLVADISKECASLTSNDTSISKSYYAVLDVVEKFYSSVAKKMREQRELWRDVINDKEVHVAYEKLASTLLVLEDKLADIASETPGLAQSYKRVGEINGLLDDFKSADNKFVQWIELGRRRFRLGSVPLNVAVPYQKAIREYQCAWVYTSATLTAKQSFDHFTEQLGLNDSECVMCDSPYDYAGQSRLYLPSIQKQPNEQGYTEEVVSRSIPLLKASRGNAFMLFTSHKALNQAAELMKDSAFTILVQGSAAKRELLKQFQEAKNCVLLGTQSFWEGVDVKGQGLRLVIIDKLPFASPADPLVRARSKAIEEAGENPFMAYQIPQAILNLKQGVGRLIRGEQDCGVVVLMDPRLKSKAYGKSFLKSLPPMTISEDEIQVKQFLDIIHDSETAGY
ncbi:MAG: ATP-dependent DNA helicase [Gammaproteobacteria bacterium]